MPIKQDEGELLTTLFTIRYEDLIESQGKSDETLEPESSEHESSQSTSMSSADDSADEYGISHFLSR